MKRLRIERDKFKLRIYMLLTTHIVNKCDEMVRRIKGGLDCGRKYKIRL